MTSVIVEATNGQNWGKFMISRFDESEWSIPSSVSFSNSLLGSIGWTRNHISVFDLQTGEGAMFLPGGKATYDLDKHKIWVCALFEPFLLWLYQQKLADLHTLPKLVNLPNVPFAMRGFRRPGVK